MITLGFTFAGLLLATAMALSTIRILRGPSSADRVVALDLMAFLLVGALAMISYLSRQPVLLDVALVVCASAFAATLGMARHIAEGERGTTAEGGAEGEQLNRSERGSDDHT